MSLYVIFGYNTKPNPNRTADQMAKEGPISGSAGHNSVKKGDRVMKILGQYQDKFELITVITVH